jgi:hypothetical protein
MDSESEHSAGRDQPSAAMALGPQLIGIPSADAAQKTAPISAENAVDVHSKVNGKIMRLR